MDTETKDPLPADLAGLHAEASALDAEAAPPPVDAQGQIIAPVDYTEDAKGLLDIIANSMEAFWPSTAEVLTAEKRAKIAAPLAKVMEKHDWSLANLFGKWGEEIALGFVVAQVAVPVATAIRKDRAAKAAVEKATDTQLAAQAPGASTPGIEAAPDTSKTPAASFYQKA